MKRAAALTLLAVVALAAVACGGSKSTTPRSTSYAIYAEYARAKNKLMKSGLNRRVFNKVEAQHGRDITLNGDGSITLEPGTYRISGYSITTMQTTFAPPTPKHDDNYPGYAIVYRVADESLGADLVKHALGIGSPQNALDTTPSLFDLVYTTKTKTAIAVGHQSGSNLHDEVYLSVYEVNGVSSDYHVFAQIAITKV